MQILEKKESSDANNLRAHLRKLEKKEQIKRKMSRRKEIIKNNYK